MVLLCYQEGVSMKKLKNLCIIMCCAVMLFACGGKPASMSDEVYEIGVEALRIADQYFDAKITVSEAKTKTDKLYDKLEDDYSEHKDRMVKTIILGLSACYGLDDDIEIKDSVDRLSDVLGK